MEVRQRPTQYDSNQQRPPDRWEEPRQQGDDPAGPPTCCSTTRHPAALSWSLWPVWTGLATLTAPFAIWHSTFLNDRWLADIEKSRTA
jgi:hypothetical protein